MKKYRPIFAGGAVFLAVGLALSGNGAKVTTLITGTNAFVSSKDLVPGSFRKIAVADLPDPNPPTGRGGFARPTPPPEGALPSVPAGFKVAAFAEGLKAPRQIRRGLSADLG